MKGFYKTVYPLFDDARFYHLMQGFSLDPRRKISTFSKGMKKQLSVICAVSSGATIFLPTRPSTGLTPLRGRP